MGIKLMITTVFLCITVISTSPVWNRSLEIRLQSVENHTDNIQSQMSYLKENDEDIWTRLAMNTNLINILSNAQATNLKNYRETSNNSICMKQLDSLTQKYDSLLEKYETLENKKCPSGWFPYMNSCYILKKEAVDWFQAQEWCKKNEAKLVEYSDMDEVTFVLSTARSYHYWGTRNWAGFWVGATDLQHEGVFKWSSSHNNLHFNYWLQGQPDKISVDEDCMVTQVNQQGKWNYAPCKGKLNFVCEM
ncbi:low affinity immunoglobulin epsilon Fc receptor-like [Ruditapes philippinarum]|uniref:low affinity immunoglobulin epsilon Fc receptor-like n=1 Tax=Ruditapes philippinarum TaxID=129788 RepID=UPI00295BC5A6|nr:low affinity immunoglobulin epsilon Fc receptor-like [Ruditapes philippinarum]